MFHILHFAGRHECTIEDQRESRESVYWGVANYYNSLYFMITAVAILSEVPTGTLQASRVSPTWFDREG